MNYKHSGNPTEIIYALPTIRAFAPGSLFVELAAWPLMPLLRTLPYLESVSLHNDEPIDMDLDLVKMTAINFSCWSIPRWYALAFDANPDPSTAWLDAEANATYQGRLVVGRSTGNHNPRLDYRFLDEYKPLFVGSPNEYFEFRKDCPNANFCLTANLFEDAKVIKAAKLFVGNQSTGYALAEGLKVPRVLETYLPKMNVIPEGPGGHAAVNQIAFETHVRRAMVAQSP